MHVTTHIEGHPYEKLLSEKGGTGFPTLMFLDAEGEILARQNEREVAAFEKTLVAVNRFLELSARAAKGDKKVANELFLTELQLGRLEFKEASERYASLTGFTKEQEQLAHQLLLNAEVKHLRTSIGRSTEARLELGKQFVAMAKEGRIPTEIEAYYFWSYAMAYAESAGDADAFEQAMNGIRAFLGDDPRYQRAFTRMEETLAKLRQAKP